MCLPSSQGMVLPLLPNEKLWSTVFTHCPWSAPACAGRGGRCHHQPLCLSQVEFCKAFGDPTKPRAWSKHAQKSSQSKPPPKDKDAISTEPKKVRGWSLPAISRVSAEQSPREGRVVGGRGI